MLYAFGLFADASWLANPLVMFIPIILLFYFMMIRPAQRQERERRAMLAALKKNDRVIAAGGILGTVTHIKENPESLNMEDEVTVKVDDNVKIRVIRSAIHRILVDTENGKSDTAKDAGQ